MNTDTNVAANDEDRDDFCMICMSVCGRADHAGDIGVINAISLIQGGDAILENLDRVKARKLPVVELNKVVRELTLLYAVPIPEALRDTREATWNYLSGFASVIMNHVANDGNEGTNIAE